MTFIRFLIGVFFVSNSIFARGYDVFGIGYYDVKLDGSSTNQATYFRYERRFDKVLVDIGPEEDNYFYLKHRKEMRGIGGIFFDYKMDNWNKDFAFIKNVGNTFVYIFKTIIKKHWIGNLYPASHCGHS